MSFFIKAKGSNKRARSKGINRKSSTKPQNDEITSSEDEEPAQPEVDRFACEDQAETAQEKKLRLAKVYLEEIEREECRRLEREDLDDDDVISKRLRLDNLKQAGRLRILIADQYTGADIAQAHVLHSKDHRKTVTCLCLSSDNQFVFSGSKDGSLVKWSLFEYKKVASRPFVKNTISSPGHCKPILSITLSSDDTYLAVGDASQDIQIWSPMDLRHVGALKGHRGAVTGLKFRGGTHTLYSCSEDKSVKVWSVDEMAYVETLYGHQGAVMAIDALTRERAVTAGGRDTSIRLWKIAEESHLVYNGHTESIEVVCLINEANFVSGGGDGQLSVWSSMKKKPLCTVKEAHGCDLSNSEPFGITAVASLQNTDLIASSSSDGVIRVWKLGKFRTITPVFTIDLVGFVNDLAFTTDGRFLIAGVGNEHRLGRWTVIKAARNSVVVIPLIKV